MYEQHFGLQQPPFSIAPDPRYLYMSERHREALAHLLYGVRGGGGFVVLTGEIGAGKTTVCRCFLEQIPPRCNVAYIFNPKLTVEELLSTICAEFRIPCRHPGIGVTTVKDYVDALNEFLLRMHSVGQNNVLIIDEAQNLSAGVLEQLRLLTNLETNERKLLQIVLIGQPELRTLLARRGMQQLAQRVIARYHLGALAEEETAQYVRHRLSVAGLTGAMPFDDRALARLHHYSRGVPRRINLLADRALLGAYAKGRANVDLRTIDEAAAEVFDQEDIAVSRRPRVERAALIGLGLLAGAAVAGAVAFAIDRFGRQPAAGVVAAADASPAAAAALPAATAAPANTAPEIPKPISTAGAKESAAAGASASSTAATPATNGTAPAADTAAAAPPARIEPFDLPTGFAALIGTEKKWWRELAQAWNVDVGTADPCLAVRKQQVHCFSSNSTLALIRLIDRPGILTLRDAGNRPAYALLSGLSADAAIFRIDGTERAVPLVALADYWRGEYSTLWRVPPDYSGAIGPARSSRMAYWLALQLASARGDPRPVGQRVDEATLKGWIHAFQLTQGLPSDGVPGPVTLMQLNRAIGVDEPRLRKER
jgi:general secretion pathway protein A